MATFNIIGNGFDSYHGLPTDYYYFACYVLLYDEQLYDDMANMYGFNKGLVNGHTGEVSRVIANEEYWSEFEKRLAYLSVEWVENSLQDELFLECPDAVELEIEKVKRVSDIKDIMNLWVIDTVDKETNFQFLKAHLEKAALKFDSEDTFLSFNYTHTLEKVYGINKVFHIHGEASNTYVSELILGHGDDEVIDNLQKKIAELELKDYCQAALNRKIEYKFEKQVLQELRKPVGNCIARLVSFINKIKEPDEISLYGLSLGKVDLPYLEIIRNKWPACKWKFSYHNVEDQTRIKKTVNELKLDKGKWTMFHFNNPNYKKIRDKIVNMNKIVEYKRV